jgi:hypothetical protein
MYTVLFFILALTCSVAGWTGDMPILKALGTLFAIMYFISLVFDVADRRERRLEEEAEEEEEKHLMSGYFKKFD